MSANRWREYVYGSRRWSWERPGALGAPLGWTRGRLVLVDGLDAELAKGEVGKVAAMFGIMAVATQHLFAVVVREPALWTRWMQWVQSHAVHGIGSIGRPPATRHPFAVCAESARALGAEHEELAPERIYVRHRPPGGSLPWPLPNVLLLGQASCQADVDERFEAFMALPAASRGALLDPLVGRIVLSEEWLSGEYAPDDIGGLHAETLGSRISWLCVGGEPAAETREAPPPRPCEIGWILDIIRDGKEHGIPVFIERLGAHVIDAAACCKRCGGDAIEHEDGVVGHSFEGRRRVGLADRSGQEPSEWMTGLRMRRAPLPGIVGLLKGQKVYINAGPYSGHSGIIAGVSNEPSSVRVRIQVDGGMVVSVRQDEVITTSRTAIGGAL